MLYLFEEHLLVSSLLIMCVFVYAGMANDTMLCATLVFYHNVWLGMLLLILFFSWRYWGTKLSSFSSSYSLRATMLSLALSLSWEPSFYPTVHYPTKKQHGKFHLLFHFGRLIHYAVDSETLLTSIFICCFCMVWHKLWSCLEILEKDIIRI